MHAFQPFDLEQLDFNPFTMIGNDWALLTAGDKNKFNTMTISWGGVGVLWGKKVAFVFVRESRYTKEFLDNGAFFSLSFLNERYKNALNLCGSKSGRDIDKFKEANLVPAFSHGIPYVDDANLVLLCNKLAQMPIEEASFVDPSISSKWYADKDMHTMYIAEIIEAKLR